MTEAKTRQSRLSDATPYLGPGLFVDERAQRDIRRVYLCALRFVRTDPVIESGVSWREARKHLRPAIVEIVRWYWANREYDDRVTFADMKPKVSRLQKRLRRFKAALEELPRPIARALEMQMSPRRASELVKVRRLSELNAASIALDNACAVILDRKNKKGCDVSVKKACAALWDVWEAITGQPFKRTWEASATRDRLIATRGSHEFASLDPLFVQVALCAIDPEVTLASIRSGLKEVAREKSKSG